MLMELASLPRWLLRLMLIHIKRGLKFKVMGLKLIGVSLKLLVFSWFMFSE